MAGMVAIYKTPADMEAFDKHYFGTHIPLAKKMPGLLKYEVSQGPVKTVAGADDVYLMECCTLTILRQWGQRSPARRDAQPRQTAKFTLLTTQAFKFLFSILGNFDPLLGLFSQTT
ncbi:MAG: EthD family reductase [Croceibacterium sp.]